MKKLNQIIVTFLSALIFSCAGDEEVSPDLASVNVVNAAINAGTVKVNHFGEAITWSTYSGASSSVAYGSSRVYSLLTGNKLPLIIVPSLDTLTTLYNNRLDVKAGDIYTLYLIGQYPEIESMIVEETNIPENTVDLNTVNVRFINLSPNSPDISVTLSTSPTVTEFSDLGYKEASEFKTYSADGITSLVFQVRNPASSLMTSYSLSLSTTASTSARYHSVTLVLRGLVGGTPVAEVSRVNNY